MRKDVKNLAGSKAYASSLLDESNEFVFIKLADFKKKTAPAMVVAFSEESTFVASLAFLFSQIPHFRSAVKKALELSSTENSVSIQIRNKFHRSDN